MWISDHCQESLKNLKLIPPFYYHIYFVQCTRTNDSGTALGNGATTTMLDSQYSLLQLKGITLCHCGQIANCLFCLNIKLFSGSHLACPYEPLQILVKLNFGCINIYHYKYHSCHINLINLFFLSWIFFKLASNCSLLLFFFMLCY